MERLRSSGALLACLLLVILGSSLEAEKRRSVRSTGFSRPVLRYSYQRYATASHPSAFELTPTPKMTLQFMIYPTLEVIESAAAQALWYRDPQGPSIYQVSLVKVENEGVRVRFSSYTGAKLQIHGTRALPLRTWTRITVVADETTGSMYFGASKIPAVVFLYDAPQPTPGPNRELRVGSQFFGALSRVAIWNRPLSETEIAATAAGPDEVPEGLAAYWPLDDGSGRSARDLGPHGISLKLPEAPPDGFDPAPRWIRSEVLEQGPIFELVRYFPNNPPSSSTGRRAVALDITGDGLPELVDLQAIPREQWVCNYPYISGSAPGGYVYRNLGGGNFVEDPGLLQIGPAMPFRIRVADMTGDGREDIVDIESGPEWNDGTTCPPTSHPTWSAPGGQSRLLVTQAAGGLRDETESRMPRRLSFDHAGAVGDFDGDGDRDIVHAASGPQPCPTESLVPGAKCSVILINNGSGVFTEDYTRLPLAVSTRQLGTYNSAAAFDADRDGDVDIVMGLSNGPTGPPNLLLLNDGTGRFTVAPEGAMPVDTNSRTSGVSWVEPGDFDGDGWQDVFAGRDNGMTLFLNNRNGSFRISTTAFASIEGHGGYVANAADMNADGTLDLIIEEFPFERVLFNRGDGTFVEPPPVDDFDGGASLWPVDVDGDGDLDLIGAEAHSPGFFVMYQRRRFGVK